MALPNTLRKYDAFVRSWQNAKNVNEAAVACGMTDDEARMTAHRLRAKGIPLKYFRVPKLDYKRLKGIAREGAQ